MSITIHIYYKGKQGSAVRFVNDMISEGIVDRVRKEKGNERYEYYFSQSDPETVLLIDMWKDQASLDIHHASEIMNEIMRLREKHSLSVWFERFEENSEIPERDLKFSSDRDGNQ